MHRFRRPDRSRGVASALTRSLITAAVLTMALVLETCVLPEMAVASGRVHSRFFGIHAPSMPDAFPSIRRGAVDLTTNAVYWPQIETADDQWSWDRLDAVVEQAEAHHAQPLLVLGLTPPWNGASTASVPSMTAWKDYVRHVVKRYKSRVDYQLWPEPNIVSNWQGTPRKLARLSLAASRIIHKVAKHAVVVSPAMVLRMRFERIFMDKFFAARVNGKRVGQHVDAVGVDPYPVKSGTPEDSIKLIRKARHILRSHRVTAPLWNVEINYGVAGSHTDVVQGWSSRKQASYVVRNDVLDAAAGIKRVYWLGWFRFAEAKIQFVAADGTTPTLAAKALGVVRGWLIHQKVRSCTRKRKDHLYTCKLVRSGRASWVYWTTKGKTVVRAPQGSRHVASMTGEVTGTRSGRRLTVTKAPIRVYH